MSLIKEKFNTSSPLPSILPEEWKGIMQGCEAVIFDSLDQFVYTVSKLTQRENNKCGMSYKEALEKLTRRQSDFPQQEQELIRNRVRANLLKRGLITQEIYENFQYSTDGTQVGVDVGKYAAGEPDCVMTPAKEYVDFFYELYVNISYPYFVTNEDVRTNVAKLLATVEELERQHIFIKINAVFPALNCEYTDDYDKRSKFFSVIPLFSHKDFKSVDTMSSVVNERLLRKFYFAILEDLYGKNLCGTYGNPVKLDHTINIGDELNEIDLFETILKTTGA
jgi:hypothetical protein